MKQKSQKSLQPKTKKKQSTSLQPTKTSAYKPMTSFVGREEELEFLSICLKLGRSVLVEGPVGVGKTRLAIEACNRTGRNYIRVDGDSRYTEQKLTGSFDPSLAFKVGFTEKSFNDGPLVRAMKDGSVLFINELNRMPEGVQNILLPAIDEGMVHIPRLGTIYAKHGFCVVATQNPKEFVATQQLSEALLDRFEWIALSHLTEEEEIKIVSAFLSKSSAMITNAPINVSIDKSESESLIATLSVKLARGTREHAQIERGASLRAAQSTAELTLSFLKSAPMTEAFRKAAIIALSNRIEIDRDPECEHSLAEQTRMIIHELVDVVLSGADSVNLKDDLDKSDHLSKKKSLT